MADIKDGVMFGPRTFLFTVTKSGLGLDAVAASASTYGLNIVGVSGTANATYLVLAEGANSLRAADDTLTAWEDFNSGTGVALTATFENA